MIEVEHPRDLAAHVGQELGVSDWVRVTEEMVLQFGQLSGDMHWIHTDAERARRETPFGGIVAHGYLTLSFATAMSAQCLQVRRAKRFLNAGIDRARFLSLVKPGMRLRGRFVLKDLRIESPQATRITTQCTMEIEGEERPAMVAEIVKIAFAED